jgi:hypothetical protein
VKPPVKKFPSVDDPNMPRRSFGRQNYHGDLEPSRFSRSVSIINQYVSDRLRAFSFAFSGRQMPFGMRDEAGSVSDPSSHASTKTTVSPLASRLTEERCETSDVEEGSAMTQLSVRSSSGLDGRDSSGQVLSTK